MSRIDLDADLRLILGSSNVYFDPPESVKLKFPCIVYSENTRNTWSADNAPYHKFKEYQLTYITKDPDDPMGDEIDDLLNFCRMVRHYAADNLHHFVYTIYH